MLSASSLLAGCGGHHAAAPPPRLGKASAAELVSLSQQVARDASTNACATRQEIQVLSTKAQSLVAAGSVPARLRAKLLAGVAAVVADEPTCTPTPPATPPARPKGPRPHGLPFHGPGPGPGHGHGFGHRHGGP